MSSRPEQCKVPANVWFDSKSMAQSNAFDKQYRQGLGRWVIWRCFDHYHIRPKHRWH